MATLQTNILKKGDFSTLISAKFTDLLHYSPFKIGVPSSAFNWKTNFPNFDGQVTICDYLENCPLSSDLCPLTTYYLEHG